MEAPTGAIRGPKKGQKTPFFPIFVGYLIILPFGTEFRDILGQNGPGILDRMGELLSLPSVDIIIYYSFDNNFGVSRLC